MQVRMEMAADNDRMRAQLAAQTADIAALRQRTDEYERRSRAAQAELHDARLQLQASAAARSELDALSAAAPEPPRRFDHVPGYRDHAAAAPPHRELVRTRLVLPGSPLAGCTVQCVVFSGPGPQPPEPQSVTRAFGPSDIPSLLASEPVYQHWGRLAVVDKGVLTGR